MNNYDDMLLCRLMMRVYTVAGLAENDLPRPERCADVWEEYQDLEATLISAFRRQEINPVPVGVVSDFNGTVRKVLELVFCYEPSLLMVPSELYTLFLPYGVQGFGAPLQPPVVRLGYTGRCYDYRAKTKLITDGLQIGQRNEIVLDLFSLLNMTGDGVACRLTHELLHVFGVAEDQMEAYKPNAFFELKDSLAPFSAALQHQLDQVYPAFCAAAARVRDEHPDWVEKMVNFGNRLYLVGFPEPPEKAMTVSVYYPEKAISRTNIEWRSHEVLFM